jgi:hypothetical protein
MAVTVNFKTASKRVNSTGIVGGGGFSRFLFFYLNFFFLL